MDVFSHGLWSYIFFNKIKKPFYAVLFGFLPDVASWGIFLMYSLITGKLVFEEPVVSNIPEWVFTLYGISHSLVVAAVVILIVFLILKKIPVYMFAWPIAIVMDIVTHTREFLPTPFLWPISDWHFPGFSWGNGYFIFINYTLILGSLIYISYKKSKNKRKKT